MRRSKVSPADTFSTSPLFSLLPVKSQIGELQPLTSFFYARFEKASALRKELENQGDSEALRRVVLEQEMVKQVLDWLEVKPDKADG